jgi:hypothetical protein
MRMRGRPGGELLWMLSLVLSGVGGTPFTLLGRMGWDFESIPIGVAIVFLAKLDLIQKMGPKIKFWEDVWSGALTPKEVFPGLYNIASAKEASIAVNMDLWSGSLQWNVSFN